MAIEREDIHTFKYFDYGEAFYGSYNGMRYRVATEPLEFILYKSQQEKEEGFKIRAYAWPEPNNFATSDNKAFEDFPFSEEGVCEAVNWLNEQYGKML